MNRPSMNDKEKEFVKDLAALLDKYSISLNAWEQYGDDECIVGDEYLFEDYDDFRLEIGEVIDCLQELKTEEGKRRRKEKRDKQRQKLRLK